MINKSISILSFLLISILGFTQVQLSNSFNAPTDLNINSECNYETYYYNHDFGTDIPELKCNRMYPGLSSYFSFTIPENSDITLSLAFEQEKFFGLAFYTLQYGEYVELKCDTYKSTSGELKIYAEEELSNMEIIARFWVLDELGAGDIDICLASEDLHLPPKILNVSTSQFTVQQLVQEVLITGCLTASNITFSGSSPQIGYFSNGIPGLDFAEGVILSTGNVSDAANPGNFHASTSFYGPGDAQLNSLIPGYTTNDAAILEFDFVPASDMLEFQYVFGSEEYPTFVGDNYNDVFGFFISGGPENYNNVNLALIPGTSTPVSINNVNANTNSQYFINNEYSPNIAYNGLTTTLTASKPVTACETYHIKLAIADGHDYIYDSGVFLKANSFSSGESYTVESFNAWSPALSVMRGCTNSIEFCRTDDTPLNQVVPVELSISGTAEMGVDFSDIPTSFVIPAGQACVTIDFEAYDIGVLTGDVTIVLNFENGCPCDESLTQHTITIVDACQVEGLLTNNGPICLGDVATLSVDVTADEMDYISIEWGTGAIDQTEINVSPTTTTTYSCTIIYPCDTITLQTTVVVVEPPVVDLGPDFSVEALTTAIAAGMQPGNTGFWTFISGPGNANISPANNTNATATVDVFGTYTFSWTETSLAPNCVDSDEINITFFHIPTVSFEASQTLCYGDNTGITFTGEVVPSMASYQWDFGNATVISGVGQGPYIVNFGTPGNNLVSLTVTEADVSVVNNMNVYVPYPINANVTANNDPCFQSCNGSASLAVTGGTAPYSYSWGSTSNFIDHLCKGDYGLTVTDAHNCEFITQFTIDEPELLTHDTSYYHVNCYGEHSGNATVWADGGNPPYTYIWSDGYNGGIHDGIAAGHYTVTVQDNNGCTNFNQFTITQPNLLQVITTGDFEICENQSVNVVAQEMGGVGPYTFYWDNGDGTGFASGDQTFTVVPHEDVLYTVYVEDSHGCISSYATTDITVSPEYHLSLNLNHNSCYQSCDGSAALQIQGGLQPFQFSWASDGPNLNNLCAGLYTVTITDRIGCRADTMFVVNQPPLLQLNVQTNGAKCWYSENGTANAIVIGGTPPYNYVWSNDERTENLTDAPGAYHLTVSDDNNCRVYGSSVITSPAPITALVLTNPTICIGGEALVVGQASGGTQPYYFHWEGSDGTAYEHHQFNASPRQTTRYDLTITDSKGCTVDGYYATVKVKPPLKIENLGNSINHICAGDSAYIELDITGGSGGPYLVVNQNGQIVTSPMYVSPDITTDYVFVVSDMCETPPDTAKITIAVVPKPEVDFQANIFEACPGEHINFTSNDTLIDASYVWSFGDEVFAFVKNPIHHYIDSGRFDVSLEIRDQYGCKAKLKKEKYLQIFPKPYANFSADPLIAGILNPIISFENHSEEAVNYFWYYGDGDSTINFANPQHQYRNIGEFDVMLVSENEFNCTDTAIRTILIKDEFSIYAPTAFTPNGDGVNDCFRICGNGIDKNSFLLKIYNRWGELMFTTEEFDPDAACDTCGKGAWDGTKGNREKGDKYLPNGVYYWYLWFKDYDSIGHEFSGNVQLIR
jgi:gliding motility-associated-like protein